MNPVKDLLMIMITTFIKTADESIGKAIGVLNADLFSASGPFAPMLGVADAVQGIIRPMAITICAVCFLVQFIRHTATLNVLKWEYIAKVFGGLLVARASMDVSQTLMRAIFTTAATWTSGAWGGTANGMEIFSQGILQSIRMMNWQQIIFFTQMVLLPLLVIAGVGLFVQVAAYARMFELYFWISVAPVACAFVPLEDNRILKQFLFRFAGTALSSLAMIISIRLYSGFVQSVLLPLADQYGADGAPSAVGIIFSMMIGTILLGLCVGKSGQWTKSLMDAA